MCSPLPAFLTPANAMLSVELTNLAGILDSAKQAKNVSALARQYSARIKDAIWSSTVRCVSSEVVAQLADTAYKVVNNIFAYETNGQS